MALNAVIIDSREPKWVQQLAFGGMPVSVAQLEHGDLWATSDDGQLIAIERKTSDDLLNTLAADRLFLQVSGLRTVSPWSYLVVTGQFYRGADGKVITDRGPTGWTWAAVQGALLTVQELGVGVVFAGTDFDYEPTVLRLGNRQHDPTLVVPPAKAVKALTAGEAILAALPGIGIERARSLLERHESAAAALAELTDMTAESTPGIAEVTKRNIREALGLPDWAELTVIATDHRLGLRPQFGAALPSVLVPTPKIQAIEEH